MGAPQVDEPELSLDDVFNVNKDADNATSTGGSSTNNNGSSNRSWGFASVERRLDLNLSLNLERQEAKMNALMLKGDTTFRPSPAVAQLTSTVDALEDDLTGMLDSVAALSNNFAQWRKQTQLHKRQQSRLIRHNITSGLGSVDGADGDYDYDDEDDSVVSDKKKKSKKKDKKKKNKQQQQEDDDDDVFSVVSDSGRDEEDPPFIVKSKKKKKKKQQPQEEAIAFEIPAALSEGGTKKKKKKNTLDDAFSLDGGMDCSSNSVSSAWTTGDLARTNKKKKKQLAANEEDIPSFFDWTQWRDHQTTENAPDEEALFDWEQWRQDQEEASTSRRAPKKKLKRRVTLAVTTTTSNKGKANKAETKATKTTKPKKKKKPKDTALMQILSASATNLRLE